MLGLLAGCRPIERQSDRASVTSVTSHGLCQPTPWMVCGWSPKFRASLIGLAVPREPPIGDPVGKRHQRKAAEAPDLAAQQRLGIRTAQHPAVAGQPADHRAADFRRDHDGGLAGAQGDHAVLLRLLPGPGGVNPASSSRKQPGGVISVDEVECVVVGAGVVGLAVARALALRGREVIVLEAADGIGTETSSRNSEVIHAGIYYPAGSLMARFCVAGKHMLYAYCRGAWRAAPQLRQADRRDQCRGGRQAGRHPRARRGEWRARSAGAVGRRGARDRAGAVLHQRAAVAFDRHHRQPRLHAGAARAMPRAAGAMVVFLSPVEGGRATDGGDRNRRRRRRTDDAALPHAGELGRAARAGAGAADRGHAGGACAAGILCQGKLLHPGGTLAVFAADLSGAGARRAGHASDDRPGRAGALRARRGVDRPYRLRGRSAAGREVLCLDPALLAGVEGWRAAARIFRHPPQDRAAGEGRRRISWCRVRRCMASRDWSICSESSHQG